VVERASAFPLLFSVFSLPCQRRTERFSPGNGDNAQRAGPQGSDRTRPHPPTNSGRLGWQTSRLSRWTRTRRGRRRRGLPLAPRTRNLAPRTTARSQKVVFRCALTPRQSDRPADARPDASDSGARSLDDLAPSRTSSLSLVSASNQAVGMRFRRRGTC